MNKGCKSDITPELTTAAARSSGNSNNNGNLHSRAIATTSNNSEVDQ